MSGSANKQNISPRTIQRSILLLELLLRNTHELAGRVGRSEASNVFELIVVDLDSISASSAQQVECNAMRYVPSARSRSTAMRGQDTPSASGREACWILVLNSGSLGWRVSFVRVVGSLDEIVVQQVGSGAYGLL